MGKYIDLHSHSTGSDGTLTPSELAQEAKKAGLCAIALTDHDTVEGVEEFIDACNKAGIEGIAGVEISADYKEEMHIVGLMVDCGDMVFREKINRLRNNRQIRNIKMIELLKENNLEITEEEVINQKEGGNLNNTGRPHIARAMVDRGYVKDINEAFDKYLKKGRLCYADKETYSPKECIKMIKEAGGVAIWAHPYHTTKDRERFEEILDELILYGLDGFECMYSEYPIEYQKMYIDIAEEKGLLKSGGSDFHGENRGAVKLGYASDGQRIPYKYLKEMKERKK